MSPEEAWKEAANNEAPPPRGSIGSEIALHFSQFHDGRIAYGPTWWARIGNAINTALSASPGVEVRPLEWHQVNGFWGLIWQADDRFDHVYSIFRWKDGTFAWSFASQSRPCESVDEAKEACDQHYRARIGLALRMAGGGG